MSALRTSIIAYYAVETRFHCAFTVATQALAQRRGRIASTFSAHALTRSRTSTEYARYDVYATRGRMVQTAAQSSSALVFEAKMTELSEEDARKLQDGMTVLNSILSRASSVQGRSGVRQESTPTIPRRNERGMQTLPTCYYLSTYFYNIMLPSLLFTCIKDEGQSSLSSAPSQALQALRSVRSHFQRDAATREQRSNFAPYTTIAKGATRKGKGKKGRMQSWTVKMVCLASPTDTRVPTTIAAKEVLIEAGLGEKKIAIPDIEMSHDEFWSLIAGYFPKLEGCGGFELLRCVANSRCLESISPKIARSPKLLRAVAGTSKIYIRPVQQDLDIEPTVSESSFNEVSTM